VNPFSPRDTHDSEFFNDGFNETRVKMMSKLSKRWNYTSNDDLDSDLLELPYKGEDLSLVIILPRKRNGLENLKLALNSDKLNSAINELKLNAVNVYLPKFKIQQKYELKSALSKNLILKAFSNEADLSRINGQKNLKVSKVFHQVVIEVNERGSEAAAVTSVQITLLSFHIEMDRKIFKADHPFLYLIRNKKKNLILFIGQINRL
jgi:serpin B